MKKILIVCVFLLLSVSVAILIPTIHAFAEEPNESEVVEIEENQTVELPAEQDVLLEEQPDTLEWLKSELLPKAASAVLMFMAMWISTRPLTFNNNNLARQMLVFAKSLGDNKEISEKQVVQIMEKYEAMKEQLQSTVSELGAYKAEIKDMREMMTCLLKMVEIGFGNNTELVKKGAARSICELFESVNAGESGHEKDIA